MIRGGPVTQSCLQQVAEWLPQCTRSVPYGLRIEERSPSESVSLLVLNQDNALMVGDGSR